jgi:chromosome segregation protein
MFIKEITLHGFKSFAEKTKIEFNPGITVIVGPNGTGKSNIVDSIAWVFGEQSPKSLRGISMEDVIYLGSPTKSAFNLATVRLIINNEDNTLPIDFQEISIQRQMSRDEGSLFLLNDIPCRLIDLKALIANAGLGKKFKSIINQGELDTILTSNPIEKRHLIEDACGITKYEIRKKKAFRKLKKTDVNIYRLKDIVSEVNRQLRPLKIQAETSKRYSQLEKKIRYIELSLIVTKLMNIGEREEEYREKEQKFKVEIEELKNYIKKLETELNKIVKEQKDISSKLQECFNNLYKIEKSVVSIKGWMSLIGEKRKNLKSIIKNLLEFDISLQKNKEIVKIKMSKLRKKIAELKNSIKNGEERLKEINIFLENIEEEIARKNITHDKHKNRLQPLLLGLYNEKTKKLPPLSKTLNLLKSDINKVISKISEIRSIFIEALSSLNEKKDSYSNIYLKREDIKEIFNLCESKLLNIKSGLQNSYITSKKYESILKNLENQYMRIRSSQNQINNLLNDEKINLNKLKDIEISLTVLKQKKHNLEVKLKRLIKRENILNSDFTYRKKLLSNLKNIKKKEDHLYDIFYRMGEVSNYLVKMLNNLIKERNEEIKKYEIRKKEINEEINNNFEKLEKFKEEYHIFSLNNAQLKANLNSNLNNFKRFGYNTIDEAIKEMPKILSIESIEKKEKEVENLKRELHEIGPTNPIALEDYQKLDDRKNFLNEQIEDLKNAKKDLLKLISQLEHQMRNLFLESFEKVDINFREIFKSLFPNGDAHLELIKSDDDNEGVDIKVNIGGIKNRAISLLSGGEKALVSIAFIFALFKIMPSPFYILDEVDAALDEINLQRFINLIEKFKKHYQLIIITHQRRTMEMADILYGVTMNKDGISKIVSEKIKEYENA